MTVSSTTTKNSYSGNGSNDTFAYGFKIFDDDDITVIIRTDATGTETVKTKTTHYTVTNVGNTNGGNVVFTGGNIPATGETVVLRRTSEQTQTTDYVANDPFPAATHEDALDKLTFLAQEQQEELDRAIKISRTNTMTSTEFTVGATDRANKVLAFDSSGEIQVTQEIGTFRGNWAASTAYEVRDLVKDTSTNNIFIVNAAHTSSGAQPLTTNANSAKYDLIVDAATATTSATAAAASATAAASSATAAANSESAASTSETNAATSATNAATSETNAGNSATSAASSATSATASASTATTKASEASTSATNAATSATAAAASETAAAASETAAGTSETNAGNSATTATTKASEAATSATNAATSASTATTKASEAATSATNAASSATAAAASQTSAAASAASAASAFDNFDDTYLGSFSSDPTTDNDGDALVAGALYFNSTANEMRVYDGANWIAATSAGNVSLILYEYTATSGQTTFSGSDDNSATLSYTVDNLQVVMNGVILDPSDYTATNGTSVVLAAGAATNDLVNIYAFKSFTTADMVSKSAGGTFAGAVTVPQLNADNLRIDGNTISSTDTNGDITLDPNGTGDTVMTGSGGQVTVDENGHITSKQSLDVATAGGRIIGASNRGTVGQIGIEQSTTSADGGHIQLSTCASGSTNPTERMRIDSSGNVGIGCTNGDITSDGNASRKYVTIQGTANRGRLNLGCTASNGADTATLGFTNGANTVASISCDSDSGSQTAGNIGFATAGSVRATINSSGHLLVAQTSFDTANVGHSLTSTGFAHHTRDGNVVLVVNRKSSDGEILELRKNDAAVGTLGANESYVYISGTARGLRFGHSGSGAQIVPVTASGQGSDNNVDLGAASLRFDDVYATSGVTTGSDQNDKQQIASLTDAEMIAAKAISKLFKTFKWNSAVAAKGDAARIHSGVMAQQVATAISDAGLDAADYAFYMANTWHEDADGNIVDADTEGATQRTRLGIRYAELLAFIGAATEQRLGDIEARLTALENAS
jgi:hypothetical protein